MLGIGVINRQLFLRAWGRPSYNFILHIQGALCNLQKTFPQKYDTSMAYCLDNAGFDIIFVLHNSRLCQYMYSVYQRLNRKDRLPRYFYCCRQLANLRIVLGICLYNALLGPICYKLTELCFTCCRVLGFCRF